MARGNNRGRGGPRGSPHAQASSPGRGGRGGGRRRGRGGVPNFGRGGGGGGSGAAYMDALDFPVQLWPDQLPYTGSPRGGRGRGRGQGRGRGSYPGSGRDSPAPGGMDSPRGRGSFRGRGRGDPTDTFRGRGHPSRGQLNSKLRAGVPLSKLLFEDRPLLKPILFVRSVHTATLFQEEEDILQPLVEPVADDETSHVPTADQVSRIFSGRPHYDGEEEIEEVDFANVGKIQAEVDAIAATIASEQIDTTLKAETQTVETFTGFFVDTNPAPVAARPAPAVMTDRMEGALGEDEEVIVYVAPHPRLSRATTPAPMTERVETLTTTSIITGRQLTETQRTSPPSLPSVPEAKVPPDVPPEIPPVAESVEEPPTAKTESQPTEQPSIHEPPSFESVSFSFETSARKKQTRKLFPVGGPRSLLQRSKKARRRTPRHLGAFGAMVSEAQVQREGRERDPREAEQRRGDSDVNFGESSDEGIEEVSNGIGAMDLDADADYAMEAMQRFVQGMSAEGSRHVTMDDIADEERMKAEDEQERRKGSSDSGGSDDESDEGESGAEEGENSEDASGDEELEGVLDAEERALLGETSEEDEDDESSDEEDTPQSGFQARLAKIRARDKGRSKGKGKIPQLDVSSDEDMKINRAWADEDEDFIAEIQDMLDANAYLLSAGDKKPRNKLSRAIEDGAFDDDDDEFATMMTPARRRKDKHVPAALQEQWEKDRQKKAENKRKRREAIIATAADPLAVHKGGKKGRKAMLAAARLESHVEVEHRVVDLASLEGQIRRFLADIDGKGTMALPPCDKHTRAKIHELANAFNLKSQSKGYGASRYTTLIKTSRSGIGINEKKIKRVLKTNKDSTWDAPGGGKGKGRVVHSLAKHREGEEVGKAAPKIGESNVGFRMLAAMGWAEGDRIGLSGGLDAPLTAKMKKTKLGLGATM